MCLAPAVQGFVHAHQPGRRSRRDPDAHSSHLSHLQGFAHVGQEVHIDRAAGTCTTPYPDILCDGACVLSDHFVVRRQIGQGRAGAPSPSPRGLVGLAPAEGYVSSVWFWEGSGFGAWSLSASRLGLQHKAAYGSSADSASRAAGRGGTGLAFHHRCPLLLPAQRRCWVKHGPYK